MYAKRPSVKDDRIEALEVQLKYVDRYVESLIAQYEAALKAIGDIREALCLPNVASPKSPAEIAAQTIAHCAALVDALRLYANPDFYAIPSELEAVHGMHMNLDFGHEARAALLTTPDPQDAGGGE